MRKRKDFELDLEEYIDDDYDYDENFYSENNSNNLSIEEEEYNNFFKVDDDYDANYVVNTENEDNYEEFVKVQKVESDDDYDDNSEDEEETNPYYTYDDNSIYKFLSIFIIVFKWIGVAIAIILISYFITQGNMKSLLMYILGLVIAFFFGYFFMFILNKFTED